MIKHAIVYDGNKGILVVIMSVYAIGVAILVATTCTKMVVKKCTSWYMIRAKCRRDTIMEPHMTEFVFLCRLRIFGSQSM